MSSGFSVRVLVLSLLTFWQHANALSYRSGGSRVVIPHFDYPRSLKPAEAASSYESFAPSGGFQGSSGPSSTEGASSENLKPAAALSAGGYSGSYGRRVDGYSPEGSVSSYRPGPLNNQKPRQNPQQPPQTNPNKNGVLQTKAGMWNFPFLQKGNIESDISSSYETETNSGSHLKLDSAYLSKPTYLSKPQQPAYLSKPAYPSKPQQPAYLSKPAYPSKPQQPAYLSKPAYPSKPQQPAYLSKPAYPSKPQQPAYLSKPAYPSKPQQPAYLSKPAYPSKPQQPAYLSKPAYPSKPQQPPQTNPNKNGVLQTKAGMWDFPFLQKGNIESDISSSYETETNSGSHLKLDSAYLSKPTYPSKPQQPAYLSKPTYPSKPQQPAYLSKPAYPSKPQQPAYLSKPAYPSKPQQPAYLSKPAYPSKPQQPAYLSKPAYPSKPQQPAYLSKPASPSKPAYPSKPQQPPQTNLNKNGVLQTKAGMWDFPFLQKGNFESDIASSYETEMNSGSQPKLDSTYPSKPQQPAYLSKPQQPAYLSKPQQPAYLSKPQQPAYLSKPQQPAYLSKPQQPAYLSKPRPNPQMNLDPRSSRPIPMASPHHPRWQQPLVPVYNRHY